MCIRDSVEGIPKVSEHAYKDHSVERMLAELLDKVEGFDIANDHLAPPSASDCRGLRVDLQTNDRVATLGERFGNITGGAADIEDPHTGTDQLDHLLA